MFLGVFSSAIGEHLFSDKCPCLYLWAGYFIYAFKLCFIVFFQKHFSKHHNKLPQSKWTAASFYFLISSVYLWFFHFIFFISSTFLDRKECFVSSRGIHELTLCLWLCPQLRALTLKFLWSCCLRKLIGIRHKQWIFDEHGAGIELNSHSAGMGWK